MANERITDVTLPANFADGQILYGADLNKIIDVLKAGVNANKLDADKQLSGDTSALVVYSTTALNNLLNTEVLQDGQYAILYNAESVGDGVKVYTYAVSSNSWVFYKEISLLGAYQAIEDLEGTIVAKKQLYLSTDSDIDEMVLGDWVAVLEE